MGTSAGTGGRSGAGTTQSARLRERLHLRAHPEPVTLCGEALEADPRTPGRRPPEVCAACFGHARADPEAAYCRRCDWSGSRSALCEGDAGEAVCRGCGGPQVIDGRGRPLNPDVAWSPFDPEAGAGRGAGST